MKYAVRIGSTVVAEAATLRAAERALRDAVGRWRSGDLLPVVQRNRSAYTAVRWDRGERRRSSERPDTGALAFCWELRLRGSYFTWARVEKIDA